MLCNLQNYIHITVQNTYDVCNATYASLASYCEPVVMYAKVFSIQILGIRHL